MRQAEQLELLREATRYLDAAKAYPASEIDRQPGTRPGSGGDSQQASRGAP